MATPFDHLIADHPACMAPDGAEPCPQYTQLLAERDKLLKLNDALLECYEDICKPCAAEDDHHAALVARVEALKQGEGDGT